MPCWPYRVWRCELSLAYKMTSYFSIYSIFSLLIADVCKRSLLVLAFALLSSKNIGIFFYNYNFKCAINNNNFDPINNINLSCCWLWHSWYLKLPTFWQHCRSMIEGDRCLKTYMFNSSVDTINTWRFFN